MTHAQWKTRAGKIDNKQMTPHPWNELVSPWSSSFYVIVSPRIKTSRTWARIGLRIWIAQTTSESWINFQLPPLLWIIFRCWCFFLGIRQMSTVPRSISHSRVSRVWSLLFIRARKIEDDSCPSKPRKPLSRIYRRKTETETYVERNDKLFYKILII